MDDSVTPRQAVADAYERISVDGRDGIWIELVDRATALDDALAVEKAVASGLPMPLAGRTVAVKNNVDVRGIRTTAGCLSFGSVAEANAPVVQSLVDAGAVVVGVTNLDQFATGLVGTRSPHGICPNARWAGLIAGGSSSGSAVAVASGMVDLGIGTDTAGSGRVPAAANGIIGVKPTRARVPTTGIVPACRSYDCASLFGRDVAVLRTAFAAWTPPAAPGSEDGGVRSLEARSLTVAMPGADQLTFDGDVHAEAAYHAAVDRLLAVIGARSVSVDLSTFLTVGRMLYDGAFVKERYDAVGDFIDAHPDQIDPVVYSIIHAARDVTTAALARDRTELARLRTTTEALWTEADVLVVPTVPRIPTVAQVQAAPTAVNSMLGTYTNFVNLLDLCAVSLPVWLERPGSGPPPSLMLVAPAAHDEVLISLAARMGQEAQ